MCNNHKSTLSALILARYREIFHAIFSLIPLLHIRLMRICSKHKTQSFQEIQPGKYIDHVAIKFQITIRFTRCQKRFTFRGNQLMLWWVPIWFHIRTKSQPEQSSTDQAFHSFIISCPIKDSMGDSVKVKTDRKLIKL